MSDTESVSSERADAARTKRQPLAVFHAMQRMGDPPYIEMSSDDFFIRRGGEPKAVVLVASLFHVYLFKAADYKLYCLWPHQNVSIVAGRADGDPVVRIIDNTVDNVEADELGTEWNYVTLIADSAGSASAVADRFRDIADAAQAASQAPDPLRALEAAAEAADEDAASNASDDASDDGVDAPATAARRGQRRRESAPAEAAASAPMRVTAPLVDGEHTDYATLTEAFANNTHGALLAELREYVSANEAIVARVCREHYDRFLGAADRGAALPTADVATVGTDLGRNAKVVSSAANVLVTAGKKLQEAQRVQRNLAVAEDCSRRLLNAARLLERAEAQAAAGVLVGAITTVAKLEEAAVPFGHLRLGRYVRRRAPELRDSVLRQAVMRMNQWLGAVRDSGPPLGMAAIDAVLKGTSGTRPQGARTVEKLPGGVRWRVNEGQTRVSVDAIAAAYASLTGAPATKDAKLGGKGKDKEREPTTDEANAQRQFAINDGAAVLTVFRACGEENTFFTCLIDSRAKQLDVVLSTAAKLDSVAGFRALCDAAIGFILCDDLLHFSPTVPRLRSPLDIVTAWSRIAAVLARTANALRERSEAPADVFATTLTATAAAVTQRVTSVRLQVAPLHDVAKHIRDGVQARMLSEVCSELQEVITLDTTAPLVLATPAEYDDSVRTFSLDCVPDVLLVKPKAPLPFSAVVPAVGHALLRFVNSVYDVASAGSSFEVDRTVHEVVVEYVMVACRTASAMLRVRLASAQGALLHAAIIGTNASALGVVVGTIEQRLALRWPGVLPGVQSILEPALLKDAAKEFRAVATGAFDTCATSIISVVDEVLAGGRTARYWHRRASSTHRAPSHDRASDNSSLAADGSADCCVTAAISKLDKQLAQVATVWPGSLVTSLNAAAVMHMAEATSTLIGDVIKHGDVRDILMFRGAVAQFESEAVPAMEGFAARHSVRCPVDLKRQCAELRQWIDAREVEYAAERANSLQIQANLEAAAAGVVAGARAVGDGVVTGVKTVGDGVATGVKTVGDGVVTGVKTAGTSAKSSATAVKRGFFSFGRKKEDGTVEGGATPRASRQPTPNASPAPTPRNDAKP